MSFWSRNGDCSNNGQGHRQKFFTVKRGGAALALLCCGGVLVRAQDVPPGMVASFDFTQRLEYSDNPDFDVDDDADFRKRYLIRQGKLERALIAADGKHDAGQQGTGRG